MIIVLGYGCVDCVASLAGQPRFRPAWAAMTTATDSESSRVIATAVHVEHEYAMRSFSALSPFIARVGDWACRERRVLSLIFPDARFFMYSIPDAAPREIL